MWARRDVFGNTQDMMFDLLQPYRQRRGVLSTPGVTVARIRATFRPFLVGATSPDSSIYVGIRVCDQEETAAGNTPASEPHADWMYFQRMWTASAGGGFQVYEADVRSARKIEELEQTLCLFAGSAAAEEPSTLTGTVSALLLLP